MATNVIPLPQPIEVDVTVASFGTFHHPDRFLQTAELVAVAFNKRAVKLQLFKQFGPSRYLLVEGWQMLAAMYHVSASLESDQYVTFGDAQGFEATYIATHVPTGQVISRATAMCLNTEENWGLRPRYEWVNKVKVEKGKEPTPLQQIRSMAQTRAESKVLSNLLKWVAKMAGFAVTPAEEMNGTETTSPTTPQPPQQKQQPMPAAQPTPGQPTAAQPGGGLKKITDPQRNRLWGIAKAHGLDNDTVVSIIAEFGFKQSDDITMAKYDEVVAAVEKAGAPPPAAA